MTTLGLVIAACFYFLPTIVAATRSHNPGGVFIVNLLLGWTLIGWCVALMMACRANRRARAR